MPADDLLIRSATFDDLPEIAGIYAHYVTATAITFELDPPEAAEWKQRLHDVVERGLPFLVAELDGTVVGYAYCAPWKHRPAYRSTVEDSVYVAPGQTGRGVGGALLSGLLAQCADAGVRQVIAVLTDTGTPDSQHLHHKRGFTEVGRLRRVGFKHGRWWDTVLLQRCVNDSTAPPPP